MTRWSTITADGAHNVTIDGVEFSIDWEATGQMYYDPGICSGPVERCYPPEGELEVTKLRIKCVRDEEVTSQILLDQSKYLLAIRDGVETALWDAYHKRER